MIAEVEAFLADVAGAAPGTLSLVVRHGGDGPRDTALVFALDATGKLAAVVKVATAPVARARLRDEAARLRHLGETLPAALASTIPRALGHVERDGIALLAEAPLAGRRLKDLAPALRERSAWLDLAVDWLSAFAAGGARRAATPGSSEWAEHVDAPLGRYLEAFSTSGAERAALSGLSEGLAAACPGGLPLVRLHGDFCDANLLISEDSLCVVDWDETVTTGPPGLDLAHLLASLAQSRVGLSDVDAGGRAFVQAFFAPTAEAAANAARIARHLTAVNVPRAAAAPLFVLCWVRLALQKLDYLEEAVGSPATGAGRAAELVRPELHYPVTLIQRGRCLNVALALELRDTFCVQVES